MGNRFYFNVENDHPELDPEGTELANTAEARAQALLMMGNMLQEATGVSPWNGKAWRVWVSDGPQGSGHVLFTIQLSAYDGA